MPKPRSPSEPDPQALSIFDLNLAILGGIAVAPPRLLGDAQRAQIPLQVRTGHSSLFVDVLCDRTLLVTATELVAAGTPLIVQGHLHHGTSASPHTLAADPPSGEPRATTPITVYATAIATPYLASTGHPECPSLWTWMPAHRDVPPDPRQQSFAESAIPI